MLCWDTAGMHQEERPAMAMTPLEAAMTRDFLAGTAQSKQRCAKEGKVKEKGKIHEKKPTTMQKTSMPYRRQGAWLL
ncbi:hypothetical protein HYALB_00000278 [Hymenoscyphus albidus]|uniref:Uncharacterized protein n=1 Tax=Hymenoscyphus albidus TaxID=595503 RepID=A0A9N9LPV7_9HELO|nr:hypothetical protein HYALB_00000278 [Hymenoscyphus albidus]